MVEANSEPPKPPEEDIARESTNEGRPGGQDDVRAPIEQFEESPATETSTAEDESQYPTGRKFHLILLAVGLALIVQGLDSSIVAVAVPKMTDYFHTSADVGWYSSAYRLSMCSFQFMFGKLYKLFRLKSVYLISLVIFLIGSIICATAPTSMAFVIGRAVCGFAAAGIISGCFALMIYTLPLRKRALFASIANATEGVSVISSPLIGGVLVEKNWRWCFWINLPIGGLALLLVALFLNDIRPTERTTWRHKLKQLDLVGNVVFVPSLTSLFMALSWAGTKYPWNSPVIIALFCIFGVLLAVFAVDQWIKQDSATLPPKILKNRSVLAGFAFSLCCNSAVNVIEYYLPIYLQAIRNYGPAKSGILMAPIVVGFLLSCLIQGAGVNIIGYYGPFMLAGSILMPIFAGLMTTLTIETGLGKLIAYSGFLGFAVGIGFQAPQIAVQHALPAGDANIGLAIILFGQGFGPALFVALAQTLFTNRLIHNLQDVAPKLNASSLQNMGLTDLKNHIGPEHLHEAQLGFDKSLMQTWYLSLGLTCFTLIGTVSMEWKSVKQKRR